MKILITMPEGIIRDSFIPSDLAAEIESFGNVMWNTSKDQFSKDQLKEALKEVDLCITGWGCPNLNKEVLSGANKLKLIAHTGGTVAPIVSEDFFNRGIRIISGNALYAESVAEGVIAYMLASLRDIPLYANEVEEGRWSLEDSPTDGLIEQTVGLVGFGMITKNVIKMLKPFRVKIKVYSSHITDKTLKEYGIEKATLEEIFSSCKVISLHSSQRPDTYHMIGGELLSKISRGSVLVNTARGSIIDEIALADELEKGRFKAILDVYETEPLQLDSRLRGLPNVILIPHMGGPTYDRRKFVTLNLIEDFKNFFKGQNLKFEISKEYAGYMTRE